MLDIFAKLYLIKCIKPLDFSNGFFAIVIKKNSQERLGCF